VLAVELLRDGRDPLHREVADRPPQELVLVREIQVHVNEPASSAINRTP
jgi:hypothetical protein